MGSICPECPGSGYGSFQNRTCIHHKEPGVSDTGILYREYFGMSGIVGMVQENLQSDDGLISISTVMEISGTVVLSNRHGNWKHFPDR